MGDNACMNREQRARELLATADAGMARTNELHALSQDVQAVAHAQSSGLVALLSLLPLVSSRPEALGFVSDAMDACSTTMRLLEGIAARLAELATDEATRMHGLSEQARSMKVEP